MTRCRLLVVVALVALPGCVADRPATSAPAAPQPRAAEHRDARPELSLPDTAVRAQESSPAQPHEGNGGTAPVPADERARARELAKRKIDENDLLGALEVLAPLVGEDELAAWNAILRHKYSDPKVRQASALLLDGRPEQALALTREALVAAPGDPHALVAHGEANLQLGKLGSSTKLIKEALDAFRQAGPTPEGQFGAARAARELGRLDEALEHAREGWTALRASPRVPQPWPEEPERTLARALWDVFEPATRDRVEPEQTALAEETHAALLVWLALSPQDEWAWTHAADVDARRGRKEEELSLLQRGLASVPASKPLAERIDAVAREIGGDAAVLAAFNAVRASRPDCALASWHAARARFEPAIARLAQAPVAELQKAEEDFAAARALDASLRTECLRYEVLCRGARGWIAVDGGRLGDAADRFRSMERRLPGGMQLEIPGKLKSGVAGLAEVADAHGRKDELKQAAKIYLELHEYQPDRREWAMLAGAFKRDAGRELELLAKDCKLAADGKITGNRLKRLLERADVDSDPSRPDFKTLLLYAESRIRDEVQELYKRSYGCYRDAWRLDPADARAMVEGASVAIEHLELRPADREEAKRLLTRARQIARDGLAVQGLPEERSKELRDLQADACELLGVFLLELENDPKQALQCFKEAQGASAQPEPALAAFIQRCNDELRRR
jgi:tetratricopeptide (TPR) repeat protein